MLLLRVYLDMWSRLCIYGLESFVLVCIRWLPAAIVGGSIFGLGVGAYVGVGRRLGLVGIPLGGGGVGGYG